MRISDWSSDVCSSDLIDAGIGVLTFQFTEIAAKGSGSNVSLLIGNPTNAAITDMTIWASWGPLNADGNPDYSKAASGELKIKGEIPGGRWSSHKVMIDGTKPDRSEEHTSELQSLMRISYAVFCLKKKKKNNHTNHNNQCIVTRYI